jgi:hypothetical protein
MTIVYSSHRACLPCALSHQAMIPNHKLKHIKQINKMWKGLDHILNKKIWMHIYRFYGDLDLNWTNTYLTEYSLFLLPQSINYLLTLYSY